MPLQLENGFLTLSSARRSKVVFNEGWYKGGCTSSKMSSVENLAAANSSPYPDQPKIAIGQYISVDGLGSSYGTIGCCAKKCCKKYIVTT